MDSFVKTAEQILKDADESTMCLVCQQRMNNPACLPCGHIGCKECLERHISENHKCPQCRNVFHITAITALFFPFNEFLSGLSERKADLEGCMNRAKMEFEMKCNEVNAVRGEQNVRAEHTAALIADLEERNRTIATLLERKRALEDENTVLCEKLRATEATLSEVERQKESLEEQVTELDNAKRRLAAETKRLGEEKREVEKKTSEMEAENARLMDENEILRKKESELESEVRRLKTLEDELKLMSRTIERLTEQVESEKEKKSMAEARCASLEAELDDLRERQIAEARKPQGTHEFEAERQKFLTIVESLRAEITKHKQEIVKMREDEDRYLRNERDMREKANERSKELADKKSELFSLTAEISNLNAKVKSLEDELERKNDMDANLNVDMRDELLAWKRMPSFNIYDYLEHKANARKSMECVGTTTTSPHQKVFSALQAVSGGTTYTDLSFEILRSVGGETETAYMATINGKFKGTLNRIEMPFTMTQLIERHITPEERKNLEDPKYNKKSEIATSFWRRVKADSPAELVENLSQVIALMELSKYNTIFTPLYKPGNSIQPNIVLPAKIAGFNQLFEGSPRHVFFLLTKCYGTDVLQARMSSIITPDHAHSVTAYVMQGLRVLHSCQMYHRAIHPANLFVTSSVDGHAPNPVTSYSCPVLIGNFSSVAIVLDVHGARDGPDRSLSGKQYLRAGLFSPPESHVEHFFDEYRAYDWAKFDVWSVGCLIHFLVTGRPPFTRCEMLQLANRSKSEQCMAAFHSREFNEFTGVHNGEVLFQTMKDCLQIVPNDRPTIGQLLNKYATYKEACQVEGVHANPLSESSVTMTLFEMMKTILLTAGL